MIPNTVVWAAKGHGKTVLEPYFKQLDLKQRSKIRLVSGDGARWIKDTVEEYCPNAEFCIDPFHVVSWYTKVLDEVRREEWNKARAELAKEKRREKNPDAADQRAVENKRQQLNSVSRQSSLPSIPYLLNFPT
jgi:transposase